MHRNVQSGSPIVKKFTNKYILKNSEKIVK